jgi:hypothetical protein
MIESCIEVRSLISVPHSEGWNQYMHNLYGYGYTADLVTLADNISSAISYPRCSNPSSQTDSDCGSEGWAFALFIAWNLLSMVSHLLCTRYLNLCLCRQYIFVNMFTGMANCVAFSSLPTKSRLQVLL